MSKTPILADNVQDRVAEEILERVCRELSTDEFTVKPRDVTGTFLFPEVSYVRAVTCKVLYDFCPNYCQVGRWLGKHSSSVKYNTLKVENLMSGQPALAEHVAQLLSAARAREMELRGCIQSQDDPLEVAPEPAAA